MLTRSQKAQLVQNLAAKLAAAKAVIFVDYDGLSVARLTELRRKLRERGVEMKIARKTLIDLALQEADLALADVKEMKGQVGVIWGKQDEVEPAQIFYKFSKAHDQLKILGGVVNRGFLGAKEMVALANLPSRQQLLGQLVGGLAWPLSGLVRALQGNLRNLVYILSQIKK